jgi:zinc D-Ala-D-Ala dipeptidase
MVLRLLITLLLAAGLTPPATDGAPPVVPRNEYGLPVVESGESYRRQVRFERDASLVDLRAFIPGVRTRLVYATRRNPTGRVLYDARRAYLRLPAALALRGAQRELARRGLGLLVFDAYRPYSATVALWQAVQDPAYAAPPTSGSRHNRAAAVDLTLVDMKTGRPLRMPTAYDTFSPRASHRFAGLPPTVRRHRELLRAVMERHGFVALEEEWWHYDFARWQDFVLLDVPLSTVGRVRPRADVWLLYPPLPRLAILLSAALP